MRSDIFLFCNIKVWAAVNNDVCWNYISVVLNL